jgi:hypothetical protein
MRHRPQARLFNSLARGPRTNFGELVFLPLTVSFSQKVFGSFEARFMRFSKIETRRNDENEETV